MKKLINILFVLVSVLQMNAQTMSSVPLAEVETLHSEIVGDDYVLQITLPYPFNPQEKKYPVLYYLDAFGTSGGINELSKGKMWSKSIDQIILVGISYETNPMVYGELRRRDYIPPITKNDTTHTGDDFLNFIKTELIPHMEENYGADPNDRGLLGFSLGGLFSTWAFKQEPELFHRLAIISPSLWFGEEFLLEDAELIENIKNSKGLKVFLSYGSLEGADFIELGNVLNKLLSVNESIEVTKVVFDGETHGSVWNAATTRAILTLYEHSFKLNIREGMAFYTEENYTKALKSFEEAFNKDPDLVDEDDRYNIACLYALTNDTDNAFYYLLSLADEEDDFYELTLNDSDLKSLHDDDRWNPLLKSLQKN